MSQYLNCLFFVLFFQSTNINSLIHLGKISYIKRIAYIEKEKMERFFMIKFLSLSFHFVFIEDVIIFICFSFFLKNCYDEFYYLLLLEMFHASTFLKHFYHKIMSHAFTSYLFSVMLAIILDYTLSLFPVFLCISIVKSFTVHLHYTYLLSNTWFNSWKVRKCFFQCWIFNISSSSSSSLWICADSMDSRDSLLPPIPFSHCSL